MTKRTVCRVLFSWAVSSGRADSKWASVRDEGQFVQCTETLCDCRHIVDTFDHTNHILETNTCWPMLTWCWPSDKLRIESYQAHSAQNRAQIAQGGSSFQGRCCRGGARMGWQLGHCQLQQPLNMPSELANGYLSWAELCCEMLWVHSAAAISTMRTILFSPWTSSCAAQRVQASAAGLGLSPAYPQPISSYII